MGVSLLERGGRGQTLYLEGGLPFCNPLVVGFDLTVQTKTMRAKKVYSSFCVIFPFHFTMLLYILFAQ